MVETVCTTLAREVKAGVVAKAWPVASLLCNIVLKPQVGDLYSCVESPSVTPPPRAMRADAFKVT